MLRFLAKCLLTSQCAKCGKRDFTDNLHSITLDIDFSTVYLCDNCWIKPSWGALWEDCERCGAPGKKLVLLSQDGDKIDEFYVS